MRRIRRAPGSWRGRRHQSNSARAGAGGARVRWRLGRPQSPSRAWRSWKWAPEIDAPRAKSLRRSALGAQSRIIALEETGYERHGKDNPRTGLRAMGASGQAGGSKRRILVRSEI